ncbi:MAG: NADPH-dependent 7-cyano-7-deazaguanine reductase QueF [Candidatus Omnitrophota bacterium]|jgi:7-cyano-7-deazaguanine reductase|nr:MAG: NADPH-dependent 7-cyano-7-deazaguanine reductase QueF [Candidatus Omnitrophota bacterium]
MKRKSSYEGLQSAVRKLRTPKIEVWRNQYPDREYSISMDIPEFTCICPKTGLPDFADIKIEYSPNKYCIELKSFKLYTISFRNVGIFHEHVINRILDDLVIACSPRWMKITGVFNPRGGITTTVSREYTE